MIKEFEKAQKDYYTKVKEIDEARKLLLEIYEDGYKQTPAYQKLSAEFALAGEKYIARIKNLK